ncbi:HAD family hydrolase [Marinithermus hydrothermalis]|uniref:HAD-superfamily hydrolase, subfamily IA, variant 1 n=1 Tax=Marinithermus hydrothermalis (strain DSM 14884 / JCM 11576 / T1) TaxID=869210 RepID=F2NKZ9_MARHT|nr:HAD family hydrolase [Marinithermus hydrothermalis]AEB11188.1 HAD-superfamily hydrolase, subfamily IA, variant 1 [Marinithermus hydrothermalis DSM 14884]
MKRAVLFDIGDTLILTHPKLWLEPFLAERNLPADWSRLKEAARAAFATYQQRHLTATTLEEALAIWYAFDRALLEGLGVPEAEKVAQELVRQWDNPAIWPLAPHAREVLEALRYRGYRLGVVSNWDGLLPHILRVLGLAEHFDTLAVSALVGVAKPDPRIFKAALEALAVPPEAATHVGDSLEADIQAAQALGLGTVWVDHYGQHREALGDLRGVLERVA